MAGDDLSSTLEEIRGRQALAADASLGFARMTERHDALIKVAYEDTPRLVAAIEAVLALTDELDDLSAVPPSAEEDEAAARGIRWTAAKVREAITREPAGNVREVREDDPRDRT